MERKKLLRISNFIYPVTLILAMPFYLVLYGASGHRFNFTNEEIFWMCIISGAILTFFINRIANKLLSRVFAGTFATVILYGAIQIVWQQLSFTFGDDISIIAVLLLTLLPIVFLLTTILFIYSLFLRTSLSSPGGRDI